MAKVGGALAAVLFVGLGIGSIDSMPDYGAVYLSDLSKTYIALSCRSQWLDRDVAQFTVYRLATLKDAYELHYTMDTGCRDAGGFHEDGPSLTGILFIKLGVLAPPKHAWDQPFRTETGVVYPGRERTQQSSSERHD